MRATGRTDCRAGAELRLDAATSAEPPPAFVEHGR